LSNDGFLKAHITYSRNLRYDNTTREICHALIPSIQYQGNNNIRRERTRVSLTNISVGHFFYVDDILMSVERYDPNIPYIKIKDVFNNTIRE